MLKVSYLNGYSILRDRGSIWARGTGGLPLGGMSPRENGTDRLPNVCDWSEGSFAGREFRDKIGIETNQVKTKEKQEAVQVSQWTPEPLRSSAIEKSAEI